MATAAATAYKMPPELGMRYDALARSTGRSVASYMDEALADSIDRLEYEQRILKTVEDIHAGRIKTISLDELERNLGL